MPRPGILQRLRAPVYANTGSVARDHLASERTFLAWMRTGLGFIALGMAVERFSRLDLESIIDRIAMGLTSTVPGKTPALSAADPQVRVKQEQSMTQSPQPSSAPSIPSPDTLQSRLRSKNERVLVGALLGTGGGCIVYGLNRYFGNMRNLEKGQFRPAYLGAIGLGLVVSTMAAGAYGSAVRHEAKLREKSLT